MGQKIGRSGKNGTGGNPTFLMPQNVYFNGPFQLNPDVLGSDSVPSLRDSLSEQSVQHCVTLEASHATQPTDTNRPAEHHSGERQLLVSSLS